MKVYNYIRRIFNYIYTLIQFRMYKININMRDIYKIRGRLNIKGKGEINIGKDVIINSAAYLNTIGGEKATTFCVQVNGVLNIGDNTKISNSTIVCFEKVDIGENVFIGGDCRIYDTDFHSLNFINRISDYDDDIKVSSIIIKSGAFIGASSIILKGVIIGENSVIGAGSVVRKKVPDNEVWAGNPARFIKKLI